MIPVAPAAGNTILNVPDATVKSPPKAKTAIALSLLVLLYIRAPLAVKEADVQVGSSASKCAVVPVVETALLVNVTPPAVYPVPDISFAVEYAVVPAPKFALLVYNAIFKVSATKSCPSS